MRSNKGKPTGEYLGAVSDEWNLYQLDEVRFKVCASAPLAGKANYSFGVTKGKIDTHLALDAAKLRQERPDLYEAIESFLESDSVIAVEAKADLNDPFGDHALGRRRKLTPEQQWKRGLLTFRRVELEYQAVRTMKPDADGHPNWYTAIRMLFTGCFKEKIDAPRLAAAMAYIKASIGNINLEALLKVEQDYYSGKYMPDPCSQLEIQLDLLAGTGFEERKENANPFM